MAQHARMHADLVRPAAENLDRRERATTRGLAWRQAGRHELLLPRLHLLRLLRRKPRRRNSSCPMPRHPLRHGTPVVLVVLQPMPLPRHIHAPMHVPGLLLLLLLLVLQPNARLVPMCITRCSLRQRHPVQDTEHTQCGPAAIARRARRMQSTQHTGMHHRADWRVHHVLQGMLRGRVASLHDMYTFPSSKFKLKL